MDEKYIFIIWEKAQFCKNKIINDLKKDFVIEKLVYIKWDKDKFENNLLALYGTKCSNTKNKINNIGDNEFLLIILKDENPKYELRKTYSGEELVNCNVYEKKWLYRKWTGGNFRIHSSLNADETKHDLTALFGYNYLNVINNINNKSHININTIKFNKYSNINELIITLKNFNNSIAYLINKDIYIFTKCRKDVELLLFNSNAITINEETYFINLYGELECDLPNNFLSILNDKMFNDFISNSNDFNTYLSNRNYMSNNLAEFFNKYNLEYTQNNGEKIKAEPSYTKFKLIKDCIKYNFCKILYKD